MANAFYIFKIMLTARRPSHTAHMRAVSIPFWLREGYDALTFFGTIITNSKQELSHSVKYHESIHLHQAQSTHNSWICFYWKYMIFWFQARRANRILPNAGYLLNPFEMEAYANMYNLHYLNDKKNGTNEWRRYARMSLKERLQIYLSRKRSA